MMNQRITAILPMKGHSERIPNKNMRLFCGRPLYHRIAEVLELAPAIASIVIDTDSEIIARDALKHFKKVTIIERPLALRGDMVSMNAVIAHDLSVTEGEHFVQTHSTNPLLTQHTLNRAINNYFSGLGSHDSLFSVTRMQTRLYRESGEPVNHNPNELIRTQDLPPLYEENSNFYIFSKNSFSVSGNRRVGLKPMMFTVNKLEAIDIDDEEDFLLAETLFKLRTDHT